MFRKYCASVRLIFNSSFKRCASKNMNVKPPNILVYTGRSTTQRFKEVEETLLKCLRSDSYIIYHLLPSEINQNPWMENTLLLVVSSDIVENAVSEALEKFFKNFGNILFICSNIENRLIGSRCFQVLSEDSFVQVNFKSIGEVFMYHGKYSYDFKGTVLCKDNSGKSVIVKVNHDKNILISSEIYLDRDPKTAHIPEYNKNDRISILKYILAEEFSLDVSDEFSIPEVSPGFFICAKEIEIGNIVKNLKLIDTFKDKSIFHECKFRNENEQIVRPIYFYSKDSAKTINFNESLYFSNLHTDVYGHYLVYFPVITTTMEAAEQLLDYEGIVITSSCQISGKGRGTNKWISPKGCAMFTLHFTVPLHSDLGKKLPILQHIASLAVICGIKSQLKYKNLNLKIKWPNDIYYEKTKIGGLIATTVIQKDLAHVSLGWGINVANSRPTSCLNDIIDRYNSENSLSLPHLHVEEVIAFTVSQMEYFVKDFIEHGPENFLTNYYLHWMHGNQEVTLANLNQKGIITGIDEFGYLKITTDDEKTLIFQPDGNRFDIMSNLIHSLNK